MIAEDSNVYERVAIEQWLKHQITSPATNNIIGKNLLPTVQIKNLLHSRITNSAKMSCKADAFTKECSSSPTHRKVLHHHCAYLIFNLFTPLTLWRMMIYVCASNCEPVCIYLCVCVFACVRMDACIQSCGQAVNHHTLTIMHIHKICAFAYACHDANKKCFH